MALTGVDDQDAVREMLVGCPRYVLKDSDSDEIFHAIRQAASGGGAISSEVTPRAIGELTEALERERRRSRQLELAQEALLERAARRHELVSRLGHELRTPVTADPRDGADPLQGDGTSEQREEMLGALVMRAQGLARLVSGWRASSRPAHRIHGRRRRRTRGRADLRARPRGDARPADARHAEPRGGAPILEELVENGLEFSNEGSPVVEVDERDRHRGAA